MEHGKHLEAHEVLSKDHKYREAELQKALNSAKALTCEVQSLRKSGKEVLEAKQSVIDAQSQEIDRLRQENARQQQRITELMTEGTAVVTERDQIRKELEQAFSVMADHDTEIQALRAELAAD